MASLGTKILLPHSINTVWNVIYSFDKYTQWRSDIKQMDIISVLEFTEHTKDGYVTNFKITELEENENLVFDVDNINLRGQWTIHLVSKGPATELNLRQVLNAKKIYMQPFVKNYMKCQQMMYISDLKNFLK